MWSKQADTRNGNKNMTSFKNKITNRKRKNSKSRNTANDSVVSAETDLNVSDPKQTEDKRPAKSGKNRGRNRNKKDSNSAPDKTNVCETKSCKESNSCGGNGDVTILIDKDLEKADVVLRNPTNDVSKRNINNTLKRYSDSFVIENNGQLDNGQIVLREENDLVPPVLTRAVSGFFVIDHARKARRFSDLFRPSSTMKLSGSTESLKINNAKSSIKSDKYIAVNNEDKKPTKQVTKDNSKDNNNSKTKQKKKPENAVPAKVQSPKVVQKKESVRSNEPSSSYLKRVKSKIYKTKSEGTPAPAKVDEVDAAIKSKKLKPKKTLEINGRIPEDEVAVLTPNGLRKSLTHFDFRLTRQSSNLERIRPKTFGAKKSTDSVDTELSTINDKPVLAKAKSSSAINLNLLRTRRNKILEQVSSKLSANCKDVQNEFDFISFGGSVNNVAGLCQKEGLFGSQTNLTKQPSWLHIHKCGKGEVKQSQPVSRTGSDRRPDAVREEGLRHQDSASTTDSSHDANHDKNEVATPDSTTSLPATGSRRINSNINRSESVKEQSEKQRKQRRNISDPSHSTTGGDVELDRQPGLSNTDSGSSSNSSISCNGRLSESPSNSVDTVGQAGALRGIPDSDSDMDIDAEPWQSFVPPEELRNLPPHEKKRQDVINELFHTEGSHVRNLKVLYKIFYKKLQESQILKPDELGLLFPNIKEILDLHTEINKEMRRRRKEDPIVKELGDMLVNMFDDRQGESLRKAAANFCERQQLALEFIKRRRERDSKFDALLSECEKKRQCRRLPFQGILPTEMQRLSKYPLLLERLINSVESSKDQEQSHQEELARLKRAHHMSKEILNYVNEAAKVAHNRHRLEEIQKHLDTSNFERSELPIAQDFKALDLTKYKLIIEGGMQLRRPNKAIVPVHILLLEEAVIILHREGDRFLLKFFQSGSSAQPSPLSPIIKINTLLVRTNAVCKNALFLVNTSTNNSQMYDLIAEDEIKREVWFKHFSDATESYIKKVATDTDDSESVQDLPPSGEVAERAEAVGGDEANPTIDGVDETEDNDKIGNEDGDEDTERESTASPEMVAGGGVQTSKVSAEEWPLIQPSQVNIAVPPVHIAESMLTPLEQIRRKDALVKQALEDKEGLVADMMSIPREHFQHIADMASVDTSTSRDPSERVLASIFQVDQLQKAVNQSLNVSELDALTAKGGKHPACASQQPAEDVSPGPLNIPANLIRDIATSLSSQLTTLLSEVKQIEEERDMLRKELHRMKERIHVEHNLHSSTPIDDSEDPTSTDCASELHNDESSLQIISKSDCEEEQ